MSLRIRIGPGDFLARFEPHSVPDGGLFDRDAGGEASRISPVIPGSMPVATTEKPSFSRNRLPATPAS